MHIIEGGGRSEIDEEKMIFRRNSRRNVLKSYFFFTENSKHASMKTFAHSTSQVAK